MILHCVTMCLTFCLSGGHNMLSDIERLSVAERIQLVEDIWDSIAASPGSLPLTDAQCVELDARLETQRQQPQEGVSWPELKARLTKK